MKTTLERPIDELSLEQLKELGYEGTDASLHCCLAEYGLICCHNPEDDDWHCIVGYEKSHGYYCTFYCGFIEESELHEIAQDQGGTSFFSHVGSSPWEWERSDVIRKIQDLTSYLGPENIFGQPETKFQMRAVFDF